MEPRMAMVDDADEMIRLAALMFDSMGVETDGRVWREAGRDQVQRRLGADLAGIVVDHPSVPGRLVASAAGTICRRLPTPLNPSGSAGYVQWVCTDPDFRARGLARRVMSSLLAWFDGQGVGTVELHATPMAESLYVKLGFDDSGPRALRRRPGSRRPA